MPTSAKTCLLLFLMIMLAALPAHAVIYVDADATGTNNGTSWQDAYTSLQSALQDAAATQSLEIWVAEGTYRPDQGPGITPGDRTATFLISNGVSVYGGFSGIETTREQRNPDPMTNGTILSGDLLGNDNDNIALDEPTRQDNSYTVVMYFDALEKVTLSGFTICNGNANLPTTGWSGYSCGGGIFALDTAGDINHSWGHDFSDLRITKNSALFGGGIFIVETRSYYSRCIIKANSATFGGGGLFNIDALLILQSEISENTAQYGGGLYSESFAFFLDCSFYKNHAFQRDDEFHEWAGFGSAILSYFPENLHAMNCSFKANEASQRGTLEFFSDGFSLVDATIFNCVISGNLGDGVIFSHGTGRFVNTTIAANSGFALQLPQWHDVQLQNSIVVQNGNTSILAELRIVRKTTPDLSSGGQLSISNSIIPLNDSELYLTNATATIVEQNTFRGVDPFFISPVSFSFAPTTAGNFRLQASSPAIDRGTNFSGIFDAFDRDDDGNTSEPFPVDLDYQARVQGTAIDIGPYETSGFDHPARHSADIDFNMIISLSELLRVIQLFNLGLFHCDATTEDGYSPGTGDTTCIAHSSDYNPQDWIIDFSELLRLVQLYNSFFFSYCPTAGTEDGFCPGG